MSKRSNQSSGSSPVTPDAVAAATTPGYMPGADHSFTLQAVMEMQKTLGQLTTQVEALKGSVDGVKSKVDDLIGWKHKILGGAAVLGAIIALGGFGIGKFWDNISFKPTVPTPQTIAPPQVVTPPLVAPAVDLSTPKKP